MKNYEKLILDEINRRESRVEILFLWSAENNEFKSLNEKHSISFVEKGEEEEFLKLARETYSKFDYILILNPEENFPEFKVEHKEIIRDLQRNFLTYNGTIILVTNDKEFRLDEYIKPGADKLTKQILSKDERKNSPLQIYAFYK